MSILDKVMLAIGIIALLGPGLARLSALLLLPGYRRTQTDLWRAQEIRRIDRRRQARECGRIQPALTLRQRAAVQRERARRIRGY